MRWAVRESSFVSHVPIAGPLIAGIRTAWNSVSTKWYVRPIVQQQVEFNALAVQAFMALDVERRVAQGQVANLQDQCTLHEEEIRALGARCARQDEEIRALHAKIAVLGPHPDRPAPETPPVSG
jgi:hypothetical protein